MIKTLALMTCLCFSAHAYDVDLGSLSGLNWVWNGSAYVSSFEAQAVVDVYTELPEQRFLHFNNYAQTNGATPLWVHEGPALGVAPNSDKAVLVGTNHYHSAGWVFRSCRTGTPYYKSSSRAIPPKYPASAPVYPTPASNLCASIQNVVEGGGYIESPVFSNGIGTVYFEAVNNNFNYAVALGFYVNTNSTWDLAFTNLIAEASGSSFIRYQVKLNTAANTSFRIVKTSGIRGAINIDNLFLVIDNIRVSYPPTATEAYKSPDYTGLGYDYPVETQ